MQSGNEAEDKRGEGGEWHRGRGQSRRQAEGERGRGGRRHSGKEAEEKGGREEGVRGRQRYRGRHKVEEETGKKAGEAGDVKEVRRRQNDKKRGMSYTARKNKHIEK